MLEQLLCKLMMARGEVTVSQMSDQVGLPRTPVIALVLMPRPLHFLIMWRVLMRKPSVINILVRLN
jgi:hypothetical protein